MEILVITLIVLVIVDILDREWVELRHWSQKKAQEKAQRLYELQHETRRGNDDAILERLKDVPYEQAPNEEHVKASEWEIPSRE